MAEFTVFGASGWIGSALVRRLVTKGHDVCAATRQNWPSAERSLGHVVFAIGLTADFRNQPLQTAQAHITALLQVLERFHYESFLYMSSTRVYRGAVVASEETPLLVNPCDPDDSYNISKLAGESICLSLRDPNVRVARLSNVIGYGDRSNAFLSAVIAEARRCGNVTIQASSESEKDYIGLQDVLFLLERIALSGRCRLYNVASGRNVTHREIANLINQAMGTPVSFAANAAKVSFPSIEIERIRREFDVLPAEFERLFMEIVGDNFQAKPELPGRFTEDYRAAD